MRSIRWNLLARTMIGLLICVAAVGITGFVLTRQAVKQEFDTNLHYKAGIIASLMELELEGIEFSFDQRFMPEYKVGSAEAFEVYDREGQAVYQSPSLEDEHILNLKAIPEGPETRECTMPDDTDGLARLLPVTLKASKGLHQVMNQLQLPTERDMLVVVARPRLHLMEVLGHVSWTFLAGALLLMMAMMITVREVVRRSLRPLRQFAKTVETLDPTELTASDFEQEVPEELLPLQTSFADLTSRIEESLKREQRITSNIAHELRTPISELKTASDLARLWPKDAELKDRTVRIAGDVATQMERFVQSCLALARVQAGEVKEPLETVGLSALAVRLIRVFEPVAQDRDLSVSMEVAKDISVRTHPGIVEVLIQNLLDNAHHHCLEGGEISICLTPKDAGVHLKIVNSSLEIAPGDLDRLSEPFFRNDSSRQARRHAGLGLSMARAACDALGLELHLEWDEGAFVASVQWPKVVPNPKPISMET